MFDECMYDGGMTGYFAVFMMAFALALGTVDICSAGFAKTRLHLAKNTT